jgi:ketosteroid isomerase-like protein
MTQKIRMERDDIQSIQSFAEAYAAAWCSQDAASVADRYERDGSLRVNDDHPAIGREAVTAVAQGFMTAFPDMKVFLDDVSLDEGRAVFHWTLVGTNNGPAGTGRSVKISGFEEWQIGPNGLIGSSNGHFDAVDYQRQLAGDK